MSGRTDPLRQSHRAQWIPCKWWQRTSFKGSVPADQVVYATEPSGTFYAEDISDYSGGVKTFGSFVFHKTDVTIETYDDVSEVKTNDLILMDGTLYRVAAPISGRKIRRQDMFARSEVYRYSITLTTK